MPPYNAETSARFMIGQADELTHGLDGAGGFLTEAGHRQIDYYLRLAQVYATLAVAQRLEGRWPDERRVSVPE